jgi:hypothetical protein
MKILASKSLEGEFTAEEIGRLHDEQVEAIRKKKAEFAFVADVLTLFNAHGREWAALVVYDREDSDEECLLLCSREELVPVLDRIRPKWREQCWHPDYAKLN